MAINLGAVGLTSGPYGHSWDSTTSILYALGVGAGVDELEFTTENSHGIVQKVLPTFCVVAGGPSTLEIWNAIGSFDSSKLLHAEQGLKLYRELPVSAEVETVSEVVGIYDKITGAAIEVKSLTVLVDSKEPLFETTSMAFIRGEGGFGGPRGERIKAMAFPERDPDYVITYETSQIQALLYRLSGDRNPLHSDPSFAQAAGFDRPILHGLCSMGFAGRALLHGLCGSKPEMFGSMSVRFVSPVFPGDLLTTSIWETDDGGLFRTENQSGSIVLDRGRFKYMGF